MIRVKPVLVHNFKWVFVTRVRTLLSVNAKISINPLKKYQLTKSSFWHSIPSFFERSLCDCLLFGDPHPAQSNPKSMVCPKMLHKFHCSAEFDRSSWCKRSFAAALDWRAACVELLRGHGTSRQEYRAPIAETRSSTRSGLREASQLALAWLHDCWLVLRLWQLLVQFFLVLKRGK